MWIWHMRDHLCGLVVRVPGYRSRGPSFDSWCYQIFWEVGGVKRGLRSLVSTNEELLGKNSGGSRLENRGYGRGDPLRWPCDTLYRQKLALTSLTNSCLSVSIVRLWTKAMEFVFVYGIWDAILYLHIPLMICVLGPFHNVANCYIIPVVFLLCWIFGLL
jgi:hypothetical protein